MEFNTVMAQEEDPRDYYRRLEHYYVSRPSYSLRRQDGSSPGRAKYLPSGFYLNTDLDPVTGMIAQKSALARHSLNAVLDQIEIQKEMFGRHSYQIDYAICKADTALLQLSPWMPGNSPIADKRRAALESLVQSLEQEKRREEVTLLQDLRLLSRDLSEAIATYLSANRAKNLLKGGYL